MHTRYIIIRPYGVSYREGCLETPTIGSVFDQKQHVQQSTVNMSQWIIDWRNQDAADYFVVAIVNSTFLPGVDATFTDDLPGVPAEHPGKSSRPGTSGMSPHATSLLLTICLGAEVQPATHLSNASLAHLQWATQSAEMALASALAIKGKFCWDCIGGEDGPAGSSYSMNRLPPPNNTAACSMWFQHYCQPRMQGRGMLLSWDPKPTAPRAVMASFLISRGPYAFIGGRGIRDSNPPSGNGWHPLFGLDVGVPLELCEETEPNVFSRRWSKGTAKLDCNTYTASLPFKMLPETDILVAPGQ